MTSRAADMSGMRFGRLVAIRRVASDKRGNARWLCICDCDGTVETLAYDLKRGGTRSCGCFQLETIAAIGRITGRINCAAGIRARTVHSHTWAGGCSRTYRSWQMMKNRCTNVNFKQWDDYGGRGITVCEQWLNSFEVFLADIGERPDGMTLDRYPDNDGNYEPGNCRWATPKEQQMNRRINKHEVRTWLI